MRTLLASIAALGLLASPMIASAHTTAQPAAAATTKTPAKHHKGKSTSASKKSMKTSKKASGRHVKHARRSVKAGASKK